MSDNVFMVLGDDMWYKTGGLDLQLGLEWLEFTNVIYTPSILCDSVYTQKWLESTAAISLKLNTCYMPPAIHRSSTSFIEFKLL